MKRIVSVILIIVTAAVFSGCKYKPQDNASGDGIKDMPRITIQQEDLLYALNSYNYYSFCNEDSEALLSLLESLTYDGDICLCSPTYIVYEGDSAESSYGIKIDDEDSYVRRSGKQCELTEEDANRIQQIFARQLITENYQPVEEGEVGVNVSWLEDGKYVNYAFKNEDSEKLLTMFTCAQYTEATAGDMKYAVTLENRLACRYYITEKGVYDKLRDGFAKLTKAQLKEIDKIIEKCCIESNSAPALYDDNSVYLTKPDKSAQYNFKNDDSKQLLRMLSLQNCIRNDDCGCKNSIDLKLHYVPYKHGNFRCFIAFEADGAHINYLGGHAVLDENETQMLKELTDKYMTDEYKITNESELSDINTWDE